MVKNRPVYSRGAKGRKALKRTSEELLEIVDENDRVIGTAHRGVIHAHFNERRPHLMLVAYDPARTSSTDILARMNRQHLAAARIG